MFRKFVVLAAVVAASVTAVAYKPATTHAQVGNAVAVISAPSSGVVGSTVTFNATGSSGVTFNWNFGDNTTATGFSVNKIYNAAAAYTVTLTVTAANGTTAVAYQTINIGGVASTTPCAYYYSATIYCSGVVAASAPVYYAPYYYGFYNPGFYGSSFYGVPFYGAVPAYYYNTCFTNGVYYYTTTCGVPGPFVGQVVIRDLPPR